MLPTGYSPNILMVATQDDHTSWFGDIQRQLTDSHYSLTYVSDLDGARRILQTQPPDAILTSDCACLEFLIEAYSPVEDTERPLFILISENADEPGYFEVADLVLLPDPVRMKYQLRAFLNQRAKAAALQQENQRLAAETRRLQRQLAEQQRSVDEATVMKNAIVRNVSHELKTPLLHVKSAV